MSQNNPRNSNNLPKTKNQRLFNTKNNQISMLHFICTTLKNLKTKNQCKTKRLNPSIDKPFKRNFNKWQALWIIVYFPIKSAKKISQLNKKISFPSQPLSSTFNNHLFPPLSKLSLNYLIILKWYWKILKTHHKIHKFTKMKLNNFQIKNHKQKINFKINSKPNWI